MRAAVDRELGELISALKNELTLVATTFRELHYSKIIDSGTRKIGPSGWVELSNYAAPFNAVFVSSQSAQTVTVSTQPASNVPSEGPGVAKVGAYGSGVYNMAGRALTFYGNPGDTVTYTVFALTQPPEATPGSVAVTGTASVAGTVTAQTPPTADLYTESAQSRTANGNTATFAWPAAVTVATVGVNVTGFAGGTNVVISLQQQDANGTWQTIGSSAALTATGPATFSVGPGTTNGAVLRSGGSYRLAWTLTGVFTTLTFQLALSAR